MHYARIAAIAALIGLAFFEPPPPSPATTTTTAIAIATAPISPFSSALVPFYLVQGMDAGPLKSRLLKCQNGPFRRTDFLDRPSRRAAAVSRTHEGIL